MPVPLLISLVVFPAAVDGFVVGRVADERPLRTIGEVCFTVDRDEVSKTIIKRVPEVGTTTGFLARHAETVIKSREVSLRRRTGVVRQKCFLSRGVRLVAVQICGEGVVWSIKPGSAEPCKVPVRFIKNRHVATLRASLARSFSSREWCQISRIINRDIWRGCAIRNRQVGRATILNPATPSSTAFTSCL
ncbi:Acid [Hortaea werneckii]|nr:Acid [Hortaea werneckii]